MAKTKRVQVRVHPEMFEMLKREALRRDVSIAQVIRDRLRAPLGVPEGSEVQG